MGWKLKMLDIKQLAIETEVSERTIQRWIAKGILPEPTVIDGQKYWWSRKVIDRWSEGRNRRQSTPKYDTA